MTIKIIKPVAEKVKVKALPPPMVPKDSEIPANDYPEGVPIRTYVDSKGRTRVMPYSKGRPKAPPGQRRPKPNRKIPAEALGGKKAEILTQKLEEVATLNDDELAAKAKDLQDRAAVPEKRKNHGVSEITAEQCALAYKFQARGLTSAQIGMQMGLTPEKVESLLTKLRNDLRLDPKQLDIGYYMGESMAFYTELRQIALLQASNDKATVMQKMRAMEVALRAESDKNAFLTRIGVYSPLVIQRIERWIMGTNEHPLVGPGTTQEATVQKVNLAASAGRFFARARNPMQVQDVVDVGSTGLGA